MATTNLFLNTSYIVDGLAPLRLNITQNRRTVYINLDIKIQPSQWDDTFKRVINHPKKELINLIIQKAKLDLDGMILDLQHSGRLRKMSAQDIKKEFEKQNGDAKEEGEFLSRFLSFTNSKKERTKQIYMQTYRSMCKYDKNLDKRTFEDITKEWLTGFDTFLSKTSPSKNARNIHLRNIRAVFNEAIDDEVTTFYPFRRFKIRNTATVKRALTVEQLRLLFSMEVEEHAVKYRDMFKLIFFLVGINIIDLSNLKDIINGRIEYHRAKTDRLYSIKVEPEAMEIIDKYRGENYLLNILDRHKDYRNFAKRMNDSLQLLGTVERKGLGGRKIYDPVFPQLTTYWARHSWATMAASLDIPKETIAAALGHGIGNPITSIYIDFDAKKIDEANRKVIDYVLYDKR